jgi:hypothetical protein
MGGLVWLLEPVACFTDSAAVADPFGPLIFGFARILPAEGPEFFTSVTEQSNFA